MKQGQWLKTPEELVNNAWVDFLEKKLKLLIWNRLGQILKHCQHEWTRKTKSHEQSSNMRWIIWRKTNPRVSTESRRKSDNDRLPQKNACSSSWAKYGKERMEEVVSIELAVSVFVMIFKNKGSPENYSKYRCIDLLCHTYNIMSIILLQRLVEACSSFFSDWQAGFKQKRGCPDNMLLPRGIYDQYKNNRNFVVTLFYTSLDFKVAFDAISHKHLDSALAKAGFA